MKISTLLMLLPSLSIPEEPAKTGILRRFLERMSEKNVRCDIMQKIPDLARPILYQDEETGEIIPGGEDSLRADALRIELVELRKKRLAARYAEAPEAPKPINPS